MSWLIVGIKSDLELFFVGTGQSSGMQTRGNAVRFTGPGSVSTDAPKFKRLPLPCLKATGVWERCLCALEPVVPMTLPSNEEQVRVWPCRIPVRHRVAAKCRLRIIDHFRRWYRSLP